MLAPLLGAAALAAGITGAWSPCGFSMVETLAPRGYAGRLSTTLLACATFAAGALAGGIATFGGLAALGGALGAGAPAVAAVLALAAALGEARGARIVPQVRRQVPESWRRVLPVPLAAGLYGVLLGLGFTTFILSFATWALAGMAVALGSPALGLAIGLGFGAGRALPVIALAPSGGGRAAAAMAERPRILRGLRALDAAALIACAVVLAGAPAQAASTIARGVTDPSADGSLVALDRPGTAGELWRSGHLSPAPGHYPAVGGGRLAWIDDGVIEVRNGGSYPAPGANAVAISARWLVWRAGGALWALRLAGGPPSEVVSGRGLGRPALSRDTLVFDVGAARIDALNLRTGRRQTLRREARVQLRGPSALRGRLLYVRATYRRQELRVGPLRPAPTSRDRVLYGTVPTNRGDTGEEPGHEHAPGHHESTWPRPRQGVADTLWTTALGPRTAYVTRLRQAAGRPLRTSVLSVAR